MSTESKARKEAAILSAARTIFARQGFAGARMEAIAAAAGVAKGTLYLYFPGKDDIFWAALRERFVELLQRTRSETAAVAGARARLRRAVRVRFAFLRSDEAFLRIYFTEFGHLCSPGGQFRVRFRELYNEGVAVLSAILEEGMRRGEIRPLPATAAARALLDLSRDVFAARFLDAKPAAPGFDDEQFVFELFWNGVAAGAKAGGGANAD